MKSRLFLLSLALIPLLNGCTGFTSALGPLAQAVTPTASKAIDAAVTIAVTAELLKDPATTHIKAVAFTAVANQVLADTSDPTVTLAQLEGQLNARLVSLAPNPAVAASVIGLIGGLQGALNNQMSKGLNSPVTQQTVVAVSGIAKQVIFVSSFY